MANGGKGVVSYEVLANALFENYESIYDIDLETGAYNVYYESESYRKLELSHSGSDFFTVLKREVAQAIDPEDRAFVLKKLSREALIDGVRKNKYYAITYRIKRNGRRVYHQLRATLVELDGRELILIGVRDVDAVIRYQAAQDNRLASEQQKSANYLDAILATAAAFIDANLTLDKVIVQSSDRPGGPNLKLEDVPRTDDLPGYTQLQQWICDNLIIKTATAI